MTTALFHVYCLEIIIYRRVNYARPTSTAASAAAAPELHRGGWGARPEPTVAHRVAVMASLRPPAVAAAALRWDSRARPLGLKPYGEDILHTSYERSH